MSWLRVEGRMPQHRKVAPLSDAAFRLHVTAAAWCVDEETDGKIPKNIPATLTRAPSGSKLQVTIKELVGAGVWDEDPDGYEIHDFLTYNLSKVQNAELKAKKAAAGALGGKRKAEARSKQALEQTASTGLADAKQESGKAEANLCPTPTPTPTPKEILPATSDQEPDRSELESGVHPVSPPPDLTDSEALSTVPLDLAERAEMVGLFDEFARKYRVPKERLRAEADSYVANHVIGSNAGKRGNRWMGRLRGRLQTKCENGTLPLAKTGSNGDSGIVVTGKDAEGWTS